VRTYKVDAVIVMCKATALEPALNSIKNIIGDKTVFMSFQNGIGHEAIIQSIVGDEKVIGGTTTQASNILGPGHIMNHGSLPSWIGEYEGGISDRIKEIADTFTAHNLEMIAAEDVKKRKWMKLFALTAIGPLSAIFDLHHTDLYINNKANEVSRGLGKEIILETREVALADGVNVSEDECLFMFNKIVDSMQTNKSSMAFDVQYKRKTEIDFISGAVSKIEPITAQDEEIAKQIIPYLKENEIYFAGVDLLGGWLSEINITSPTCLQEIHKNSDLNPVFNILPHNFIC